jgi:hypothetical protein
MNYLYLILGIALLSLLHLTVNIAIVTAMFRDINTIMDAHKRLYGDASVYATYMVFVWITMVVTFVQFGTTTSLLVYNVVYINKDMTRYEYFAIN